MDNLQEAYLSVYQELDEAAPEKITKPAKSPRLMKDAGPARVHNPSPKKVEEETDLFDYLLEYLVAEGYADTNDNAIAIMANMSEEWRDSIVDEAYVDYRRGKLPSGRTPQQAAKGRESALTARQERDNVVGTPVGSAAANRRRERERRLSNQSDTVSMMDRSTTFGSRLSGNMRRGEPNTGPHQDAIDKRRAIKRAKEADERTRGRL
jgi:hypothetical protein